MSAMRRWLMTALLLVGCGGSDVEMGLVGSWRADLGQAETWQDIEFRMDGRYTLTDMRPAPTQPPPELGAWAETAGKLQLTPDATPAPPAMAFDVKGDRLRIWWYPHAAREYARR